MCRFKAPLMETSCEFDLAIAGTVSISVAMMSSAGQMTNLKAWDDVQRWSNDEFKGFPLQIEDLKSSIFFLSRFRRTRAGQLMNYKALRFSSIKMVIVVLKRPRQRVQKKLGASGSISNAEYNSDSSNTSAGPDLCIF